MTLRFRRLRRTLLFIGAIAVLGPPGLAAQDVATLSVEENFRREPNGLLLARLSTGARVRVVDRDGPWSQVAVTGWVWMASLEASEDPAFDLGVSVDGGENLRLQPSGTIVGRLEEGTLLSEISRQPSWAEVSRVGWIWSASLQMAEGSEPTPAPSSAAAAAASANAGPSSRRPGGFVTVGPAGAPLLTAPDGDTLAVAEGASQLQVIAREGNWSRVRIEGWMWMPSGGDETTAAADEEEPLAPSDLALGNEDLAGRVVNWTLQFISLERAEAVRTDFFEGEPFLLTRFGGGDGAFVYVAVPPDRLSEVEGLVPLERVEVTGRIRTPSSVLTGAPILDLLSLERAPRTP